MSIKSQLVPLKLHFVLFKSYMDRHGCMNDRELMEAFDSQNDESLNEPDLAVSGHFRKHSRYHRQMVETSSSSSESERGESFKARDSAYRSDPTSLQTKLSGGELNNLESDEPLIELDYYFDEGDLDNELADNTLDNSQPFTEKSPSQRNTVGGHPPETHLAGQDQMALILHKLDDISSSVHDINDRLKNTEKEVENLKSHNRTRRARKEKVDVPPEVRAEIKRETKRTYYLLNDKDKQFKWRTEKGIDYNHKDNQAVLDKLVREISSLHDFDTGAVKDAAYTFYRTCADKASAQRRGVAKQKNDQKRKRERIKRKLHNRKSTFEKMKFRSPEEKQKWAEVMDLSYMSSEETDDENNIKVHPLLWLAPGVQKFKKKIDDHNARQLSAQSKRQLKKRFVASPSKRARPLGSQWLFQEQ